MEQLKKQWLMIHLALHNKKVDKVDIDGVTFPIKVGPNGCRYVDYPGEEETIRFMEQNPTKNTLYATRARRGEKLTWGMRKKSSWILIDDERYKDAIQLQYK